MATVRINSAVAYPDGHMEVDVQLPSGEHVLRLSMPTNMDKQEVARAAARSKQAGRALPGVTGLVELDDAEYEALRAAALAVAAEEAAEDEAPSTPPASDAPADSESLGTAVETLTPGKGAKGSGK